MKRIRWVVMVLGPAAVSAAVAFIPLVNAATVGKMELVESLQYWNVGSVEPCTARQKRLVQMCDAGKRHIEDACKNTAFDRYRVCLDRNGDAATSCSSIQLDTYRSCVEKGKPEIIKWIKREGYLGRQEDRNVTCDNIRYSNLHNAHRICNDFTDSFEQPNGGIYVGWGACVPTAVANLLCMQCGICDIPENWIGLTGLEPGGGVFVSEDLTDALREGPTTPENTKLRERLSFSCEGFGALWRFRNALRAKGRRSLLEWLSYSTNIKSFQWVRDAVTGEPILTNHHKFNPVLVRLNDYTGKSGHLTTVVRVDLVNKIVVHNTWGRQFRTRWKGFHELWKHGDFGALILGKPDKAYEKYKERLNRLSWYDHMCRPPKKMLKGLCERVGRDLGL